MTNQAKIKRAREGEGVAVTQVANIRVLGDGRIGGPLVTVDGKPLRVASLALTWDANDQNGTSLLTLTTPDPSLDVEVPVALLTSSAPWRMALLRGLATPRHLPGCRIFVPRRAGQDVFALDTGGYCSCGWELLVERLNDLLAMGTALISEAQARVRAARTESLHGPDQSPDL